MNKVKEASQTETEDRLEQRRKWLQKPSKKPGWQPGDPESKKYQKKEELMCAQCGYIWIKISEDQVRCSNCYPSPQELHEGG